MEMERINDDMIKVLIAQEDLEERGVDFLDLMADHSRIEQFFYSILEEVDVERQFVDSDTVTFHVIPSERGLELYISRNGNIGAMEDALEEEILRRLLKRRRSLLRNQDEAASNKSKRKAESEADESHGQTTGNAAMDEELLLHPNAVVRFSSLQDFIILARTMPELPITNSLYYMDEGYYLVLGDIFGEIDEDLAYEYYLSMLEFGEVQTVNEPVLAEYGQLIEADHALTIFKQF